jgi:holo-[acyl-carrier protein] synthase
MIVAVGVDTIAIARIAALWQRSGARFLHRVFTADELAYCLGRAQPAAALAARFAAKEAVMKCLGTGWAQGVGFRQIDVRRLATGAVAVALSGAAAAHAARRGIATVHLSLSHSETDAVAFAVAAT